IESPPRTTGLLLDAMCALGLLNKDSDRYRLAPLAAEHLVPGKPMYVGDAIGVFSDPMMWSGFSRFSEAIKNDGTVLDKHAETPRHPFWESFAKSSAALAFPAAMGLDAILGGWIAERPTARVLDVAAGSGIYGFTIAKHPNV